MARAGFEPIPCRSQLRRFKHSTTPPTFATQALWAIFLLVLYVLEDVSSGLIFNLMLRRLLAINVYG